MAILRSAAQQFAELAFFGRSPGDPFLLRKKGPPELINRS